MPPKLKSSVPNANRFPVVAIGGSAGGLEAMKELLTHLDPGTGMAFVYIQHLDPTHQSLITEILSKSTKMNVSEAKHSILLESNCVYVIPPGKDMSLNEGRIVLNMRKPKPAPHKPVDEFFMSLAEKNKETAVGVILSGSGSDGTIGLRAIKMAGGLTFAQDETAKFQGMPQAAISAGVVDLICSPGKLAEQLVQLARNGAFYIEGDPNTPGNEISNADEDLTDVIRVVRKATGVDFTHYKMNTIKRRILRRMLLYKLNTLKDYLRYLEERPAEIEVLYHDLLINVTAFFRDHDTLEFLKKTILPRMLKGKISNEPIRVWIPACSTGEEAYSIAMIIIEVLGDRLDKQAIQIFATDLSEAAISKARLGLYNLVDVQDIEPKRLQRFFMKVDGSYRIVKSIRDLCVFAPHNIFRDPPFSRIDLISCCNLMIYLDAMLQKKILATFHYALNSDGYLVLGKSEAIGSSIQLFSQLEKKYKIFVRKKDDNNRALLDMNYRLPEIEKGQPSSTLTRKREPVSNAPDLEKILDNILLNKYIPACVLVNYDMEILLSRGKTSQFLELPSGRASLNLLKMARTGLAFELRNAIHKASRSAVALKKTGIAIRHNNNIQHVNLEVTPIQTNSEDKLFLVIFEDVPQVFPSAGDPDYTKDKVVLQLQDEITTLREDMRSIVEEQEAGMEELQSANEEIVSSNEELQSINEELETSKEEVESANEELMTINAEIQMRNEQLAESYEYAEAVFRTIREAVLVLDKDLRVKSANAAFYQIFKTSEIETEGKYVYDMNDRQLNIPALHELLDHLLAQHGVYHSYQITHNFPGIGEKSLMLNARKVLQKTHPQQLVLLAIEDITEHRRAEQIVAEREAWFRNMADNAPALIWICSPDKQRTFFNKTWLEFTGKLLAEQVGNGWMQQVHNDDLAGFLNKFDACFEERKPFEAEYRLRRKDGEYRWIKSNAKPTYTPEAVFSGYIGSCNEIHDQRIMNDILEDRVKLRTQQLEEMNHALESSNYFLKQFAYVASHDLQEPLRKIRTFSDLLVTLKDSLPPEAVKYVDKIYVSSDRMSKLIEDVLNYSSINRTEASFVKTDLNAIFKLVLRDFEVSIREKQAVINIENTLPEIEAIPSQMQQLLSNLLGNALKFSIAGQAPVITLTCTSLPQAQLGKFPQLPQDRKYYRLSFRDNGIGFEKEFSEQIFDIFQRLHDKQTYPGTGIGLALCRKIIAYHRGEISATSEENKGAEFLIILPETH